MQYRHGCCDPCLGVIGQRAQNSQSGAVIHRKVRAHHITLDRTLRRRPTGRTGSETRGALNADAANKHRIARVRRRCSVNRIRHRPTLLQGHLKCDRNRNQCPIDYRLRTSRSNIDSADQRKSASSPPVHLRRESPEHSFLRTRTTAIQLRMLHIATRPVTAYNYAL